MPQRNENEKLNVSKTDLGVGMPNVVGPAFSGPKRRLTRRTVLGGALALAAGVGSVVAADRAGVDLRQDDDNPASSTESFQSAATDWPHMYGASGFNSVSPDPGPGGESPPAILIPNKDLQRSASFDFESVSPVVADGTIYCVRTTHPEPGYWLYAYDVRDATEQWSMQLVPEAGTVKNRWSLTVAGDALYAVSSDGAVIAVDVTEPGVRWETSLSLGAARLPIVDDPPSLPNDHYLRDDISGDETNLSLPDVDIEALDPGEWPLHWTIPRSPLVTDGVVVIAGADYVLRAFDTQDGEERWSFDLDPELKPPADGGPESIERPCTAQPVIEDNKLIVSNGADGRNTHVYALDASTGDPIWDRDLGEETTSAEWLMSDGKGNIWVQSDVIVRLTSTGAAILSLDPPDNSNLPPIVDGDQVFVVDHDRETIRCLTTHHSDENYEELWAATDLRVAGAMAIGGDTLYVTTRSPDMAPGITALDRRSGERSWTYEESGIQLRTPFAIYGDRIVSMEFGNNLCILHPE